MTPQEIVQWSVTAGPASIFALMWWLARGELQDERKENRALRDKMDALRDKHQAEKEALHERGWNALNAGANTLEAFKQLLTAGKGQA